MDKCDIYTKEFFKVQCALRVAEVKVLNLKIELLNEFEEASEALARNYNRDIAQGKSDAFLKVKLAELKAKENELKAYETKLREEVQNG